MGHVINGNSIFLGDFPGRTADLVQQEGDALAPWEKLGHVVVNCFQIFGANRWHIHLVNCFLKCYTAIIMDDINLSEILSRLDAIEIKLTEVTQRLSESEKKFDQITGNTKNRTYKIPGTFESQELKNFQGALFHRKKGGIYDKTVFCEECRVELFSHGNNLMVCQKCGKSPGFNRNDMLKMVEALNAGKAG